MSNFRPKISSMQTWNAGEAKTRFSRLVAEAEAGATIVICRRNIPVAKLMPYCEKGPVKRHRTKIGWAKNSGVAIHGDFTEPALPESAWHMLR
jgi:prevent-host-death family protein